MKQSPKPFVLSIKILPAQVVVSNYPPAPSQQWRNEMGQPVLPKYITCAASIRCTVRMQQYAINVGQMLSGYVQEYPDLVRPINDCNDNRYEASKFVCRCLKRVS